MYCPPRAWNLRLLSPYRPSLSPVRSEAWDALKEDFESESIRLESVAECYCRGGEFILICNRDRFGLAFSAKLCRKCGLILTDPCLAEKDMPLYYSRHYHPIVFGRLPQKSAGLFGSHQGRLVFERVWAHDPAIIKYKARVLEIGAGMGNVLNEFGESAREKGLDPSLMGTEYSPECLAAIQEQGITAVEGGCPEVLAISGEPFDIIILSHVLEHVTDLDGFMAGLQRLASPKTLLYVEVPGILTLHAKPEYYFDFRKYFIHAHSAHYNFKTLQYHLGRFGWSCLAGDEIAHGLFQQAPEMHSPSPRDELVEGLADQVLFYLANMEATFESNSKVAERLYAAEHGRRSQTERADKLAEQNTGLSKQKNELEAKGKAELAKQKGEFLNSISWRLTAPLRAVGRLFKPQ